MARKNMSTLESVDYSVETGGLFFDQFNAVSYKHSTTQAMMRLYLLLQTYLPYTKATIILGIF